MIDYSLKLGGEAGQGLQSIGLILAKTFCHAGYHIFTVQDYESRIRGGHASFYLRFSDTTVEAARAQINFLIALDSQTLTLYKDTVASSLRSHFGGVGPDGFIIYNADALKEPVTGKNIIGVPFEKMALESGGDKLFANSVATGAIIGLVGCDFVILEKDLVEFFGGGKHPETAQKNVQAARAGFEFIHKQSKQCPFPINISPNPGRIIITGNEAIALGALAAGCRFYSGYPMTPSTGILNYMAHAAEKMGAIVEQAEDEIAAINMALGASYAGVRAMTATSGGGFALMVEGLSLAAMTETPIVIALAQRPAPATGLPTRTEQSDLEYALYAGHGEFPRAIFTPGNARECFELTARAFQTADKYQIPVFVLTDQYLADAYQDFPSFDAAGIDSTPYVMTDAELANLDEYKRYRITPSGISPRALPGQSKHLVIVDSDEHTEDGHLTEDLKVRTEMVNKRLRKYEQLNKEVIALSLEVNQHPKILLVCWGSNYGVCKEVAELLNKEGRNTGLMHFKQVWPFPKDDFIRLTKGVEKIIVVENNATGQLARLIRNQTGVTQLFNVNKYDGLPFIVDEVYNAVRARS